MGDLKSSKKDLEMMVSQKSSLDFASHFNQVFEKQAKNSTPKNQPFKN